MSSSSHMVQRGADEEEDEAPLPEYTISTQPADYPLDVLWKKYKDGDIVIPKFQREFVWTIPQASKLVESFIMGLPVPPLYLYEEAGDNKLLVVDGVQRMLTISAFIDGHTPIKSREFRLQGMHKHSGLYKKTFTDLAPKIQTQFKNSVLRCMIIRQLNPEDGGTSMYQVFSRLNTGGTALNPQEIRNCVYAGPLIDTIKELNGYEEWRKIYGSPDHDKRKRDEQLILRYMALFHDGGSYKKPMSGFLNGFMKKHGKDGEKFLKSEKKRFYQTCNMITECMGKDSLRYKLGFHAALFDSVFVAFAKNLHIPRQDMTEKMSTLKNDREFQEAIEERTSDEERVKRRLTRAESILFG